MEKYSGRIKYTIAFLIILMSLFHLFVPNAGQQGWNDDENLFIHHTKNISEGVPLAKLDYIPNPYFNNTPATFPPVFSMILVPVYEAAGIDRAAMKRVVAVFLIASILLSFLIFRKHLGGTALLVMLLGLGMSPFLWTYSKMIISDTTFLFFTLLSLALINRGTSPSISAKEKVFCGVLVGISIYLAYGTRSVGVIFVPTVLLADYWANRKVTLFSLVSIPLFVLFALAQSMMIGSVSGYSSMFTFNAKAIPLGLYLLTKYLRKFSYLWENSYIQIFTDLIAVFFFYFVVSGFVRRVRIKVSVFEIFVPLYLAIVVVYSATTPTGANPRYLIPLVPMYFFYAFYGIEQSRFLRKKAAVSHVLIIAAVMVCATYIAEYSTQDMRSVAPVEERAQTRELFDFIKKQIPEQSIIVTRLPRSISLYTSRRASYYQPSERESTYWNFFKEIGATYLVYNKVHDIAQITEFLKRNNDKIEVLFSNPTFTLFDLFPKGGALLQASGVFYGTGTGVETSLVSRP